MDAPDIPILQKAYELYKAVHGLRGLIPKADRYTLWPRVENLILEMLEGILLASQLPRPEKLPHLERVSVQLNLLRLLLRLAKDTRVVDTKKYVQLQQMVDETGRMLGGWMKSMRDEKRSPP